MACISRKFVSAILVASFIIVIALSASSQLNLCYESLEDYGSQVAGSAYVPMPFHYQITDYYCGPASLEMVFDYYGEDVPQIEIADAARTEVITYWYEMRRAAHFSHLSTSLGDEMAGSITGYTARKVGYASFEQYNMNINDLKTLISKGEPVIVLMWWTESQVYAHYRVVIGYNETHIVMHDPWNKDAWGGPYGGANTSMTYSTFLALWDCAFLGAEHYYGLWIRPWVVEIQMPTKVYKGDHFEVTVNITYPCSPPFDTADYPASSCNATIELSEGLELVSGETSQHSLGNVAAGNSVQTSWSIQAIETGFHNISVAATGTVEGSVFGHNVYPPYDYDDRIGGSCADSTVFVTILGDVDGDGNVDLDDLMLIARALGTDPRYPLGKDWNQWNPDCDINGNDKVWVEDLYVVGKNYGTTV